MKCINGLLALIIISIISIIGCNNPELSQTEDHQKGSLFATLSSANANQIGDIIEEWFRSTPKEERIRQLLEKDADGNTVGHLLAKKAPSLLKRICEEAPSSCTSENNSGETARKITEKSGKKSPELEKVFKKAEEKQSHDQKKPTEKEETRGKEDPANKQDQKEWKGENARNDDYSHKGERDKDDSHKGERDKDDSHKGERDKDNSHKGERDKGGKGTNSKPESNTKKTETKSSAYSTDEMIRKISWGRSAPLNSNFIDQIIASEQGILDILKNEKEQEKIWTLKGKGNINDAGTKFGHISHSAIRGKKAITFASEPYDSLLLVPALEYMVLTGKISKFALDANGSTVALNGGELPSLSTVVSFDIVTLEKIDSFMQAHVITEKSANPLINDLIERINKQYYNRAYTDIKDPIRIVHTSSLSEVERDFLNQLLKSDKIPAWSCTDSYKFLFIQVDNNIDSIKTHDYYFTKEILERIAVLRVHEVKAPLGADEAVEYLAKNINYAIHNRARAYYDDAIRVHAKGLNLTPKETEFLNELKRTNKINEWGTKKRGLDLDVYIKLTSTDKLTIVPPNVFK